MPEGTNRRQARPIRTAIPGRVVDFQRGGLEPDTEALFDLLEENLANSLGTVAVPDAGFSENDVLLYVAGEWTGVNKSALLALTDLTDAVVASPVTNHVLQFDGADWVNDFLELDQLSDVAISGAANGDVLTRSAGAFVNRKWVDGPFGVGAAAARGIFETVEAVSGPTTLTYTTQGVDSVIAYITQLTTPNSGLRGLHLQKKSTSALPLGVTLEYDTEPLWDSLAIDATTTDLVLAYSHALKADNWRMRADTAQLAVGRVVGQPSAAGAQQQLASGVGINITGVTNAVNAVWTVSTTLGFRVGDTVLVKGITAPAGMAAGINGTSGTISALTATTITTNHDTSPYAAWSAGGTIYVQTTGMSVTCWDNPASLLLLQGLANTITRRTKVQFGLSGPQMGSDASQDGTNDWWLFVGSIFAAYANAAGKVFIGAGGTRPTPTAKLHLGAGTTAASTAPLKFTSGTNMTTAEAGAWEYDGTNLYFTPSGTTRRTVDYLPVTPPDYTVTNHTDARSLDETGATLAQVANCLGTLIQDLQAQGRLQ